MSVHGPLSEGRDHALDAARGTLMLLGLILHAANVYAVNAGWLLQDGQGSPFFDWLAGLIHAFRMPAFFWVSGYFCALTLLRYGPPLFLRKRLIRLLMPLLVSWSTLNVLQLALTGETVRVGMLLTLPYSVPLYHLWFLLDLAVYFVLAAVVGLPALRAVAACVDRRKWLTNPVVLFLLLACTSEAFSIASRLTGVAYQPIGGVTTLYRLGTNLPYFAAGMLMYLSPALRHNFTAVPPMLLVIGAPVAMLAHERALETSGLLSEANMLLAFLGVWCSTGATIALFRQLFPRGNSVSAFLSDASYTIYLFHHVFVFIFASVLIGSALPAGVKFTVVVVATFGVCAAIHELLVRRSPALRLILNGK